MITSYKIQFKRTNTAAIEGHVDKKKPTTRRRKNGNSCKHYNVERIHKSKINAR